MNDEEESMELSGGESQSVTNLTSNLHNFSFDVSWWERAREISPPLHRRTLATPSRVQASSYHPRDDDSLVSSFTLPPRFKTQNKDPQQLHTQTVKVSQKTVENYHGDGNVQSSGGHSPMELDQSGDIDNISTISSSKMSRVSKAPSVGTQMNFKGGVGFEEDRFDTASHLTQMPIFNGNIVASTPVRHRTVNNNIPTEPVSPIEDSVFYKQGQTPQNAKFQKRSSYRQNDKQFMSSDGGEKVSLVILLSVLLMSLCIGGYVWMQVGSCSVFDVDVVQLQQRLEDHVFGQHIAVSVVVQSLQRFQHGVKSGQGQRTLVLSYHGWTGVGKNFMSNFVSESFYNAKVHTFLVPLHFPSHAADDIESSVERYKMKTAILGNVTKCGVNVFIFDEMDKASANFLTAVQESIAKLKEKPADIEEENNSRLPVSVFIFLSNSRSSQINQYLFSQLLNDRPRERISHSEFRDVFTKDTQEWYEGLKTAGLIDYYVPFLPLAEGHVKQCIVNDFVSKGRNPSEDLVRRVMEELSFFEMGGQDGQISLTGCKRVQDKVDLHIDDA